MVCKSWGKIITEEMWKPNIPWKYLRKLFVKGTTKSIKVYGMVDGPSSRGIVQYKCACQIWHDLTIYDVDRYWLLHIGSRPKQTFLMDFRMVRNKGERNT